MSKTAVHFALNLPLVFLRERRTSIAYSPALDLSASGKTPQQAKENFQTVFRLFIEGLIEHGTLEEVLEEMGWSRQQREWTPPITVKKIIYVSMNVPITA